MRKNMTQYIKHNYIHICSIISYNNAVSVLLSCLLIVRERGGGGASEEWWHGYSCTYCKCNTLLFHHIHAISINNIIINKIGDVKCVFLLFQRPHKSGGEFNE